jgi:hypothetical protein
MWLVFAEQQFHVYGEDEINQNIIDKFTFYRKENT